MLYALPTRPERIAQIPAVVHLDGTCRAQTVTREQNPRWYDLIFAFFELTGVPLLLNTSFNLAGEPLVHMRHDALDTLRRSTLDFIYFADDEKIISK